MKHESHALLCENGFPEEMSIVHKRKAHREESKMQMTPLNKMMNEHNNRKWNGIVTVTTSREWMHLE